jgi:hypothetical protein
MRESPEKVTPKTIVILPPRVDVMEMSAGGVQEKVPEWSQQASRNINDAIGEYARSRGTFRLVDLPKLTGSDLDRVDQHRALYDEVAWAGLVFPHYWPHKRERFDYTIGSGLKFLKQKTGADAALIVVGEDVVSTAGRKAVAVFGSILGMHVERGHSALTIGLVNLETGDVLWFDYRTSYADLDMRDANDAKKMVTNVFAALPATLATRKQ